jgi:RNA polymerase sigma factor (sigma-70 family)
LKKADLLYSKETAEDLVQDTFLAAVTSFNKFEGKSNPQTWLSAILNHKITEYHRKKIKDPIIKEAAQKVHEAVGFFDKNDSWLKDQRSVLGQIQTSVCWMITILGMFYNCVWENSPSIGFLLYN